MPKVAGITKKPTKQWQLENAEAYREKLKQELLAQEAAKKQEKTKEIKTEEIQTPEVSEEPQVEKQQAPVQQESLETAKTENEKIPFKELQNLFGFGFTEFECREMHDRLMDLANNYPMERTAMHKEALVTYVKYAFKRDKAIAEDDIDAADKWGKLAAKQANDAKINPNQLSAADLSGGISNFGKIAEFVEKEQDIIPILPHFRQKPQDAADYILWQFVNYIRRLQNLPTVKYSEIYAFMDEEYKKNSVDLDFLVRDKNGHYDDTYKEDEE